LQSIEKLAGRQQKTISVQQEWFSIVGEQTRLVAEKLDL
jgi:hypothetical protein